MVPGKLQPYMLRDFRQHRSTEDKVTYISQKIEDGFQDKKHIIAIWIDIEKAFDKVWKDGLRLKLLRQGHYIRQKIITSLDQINPVMYTVSAERIDISSQPIGDFLCAVTVCPIVGQHILSFRLLNGFLLDVS